MHAQVRHKQVQVKTADNMVSAGWWFALLASLLLCMLPTGARAEHSGIVITTGEIKMVGKREAQDRRPFEVPRINDNTPVIVTEALRFVGKRKEQP